MTTPLALSTRWNAGRHVSGERLVEEILGLGFTRIEIGYDLRMELIPGVKAMVENGSITVGSVHNFCPVPVGVSRPHPEIYTPGAPDRREREMAVKHIGNTLRFAAEVGAKIIVVHSGNVDMPKFTYDLLRMAAEGKQFSDEYEKLKLKCLTVRDKRAPPQLQGLAESLEALVPVIEETGVMLALENLPTWEAIPTEIELETLLRRFAKSGVRAWYDLGHAQVRDNLGLINSVRWLQRLSAHLGGMHIHSVDPPGGDHVMPPKGKTDFTRLAPYGQMDIPRVLEPSPDTPADDIRAAIPFLHEVWQLDASAAPAAPESR